TLDSPAQQLLGAEALERTGLDLGQRLVARPRDGSQGLARHLGSLLHRRRLPQAPRPQALEDTMPDPGRNFSVTPRAADTPGMDWDETLGDELAGLEVLRQLALGASHTLNNALTAILGEVQVLAEDLDGDSDAVAACSSIRREVERCARLARALCERGARRGGETTLDHQVDLAALAGRLAPLLRDTVTRGV